MPDIPQKSISDYMEEYSRHENEKDRKRAAAKKAEEAAIEPDPLSNVVEFILNKSEK